MKRYLGALLAIFVATIAIAAGTIDWTKEPPQLSSSGDVFVRYRGSTSPINTTSEGVAAGTVDFNGRILRVVALPQYTIVTGSPTHIVCAFTDQASQDLLGGQLTTTSTSAATVRVTTASMREYIPRAQGPVYTSCTGIGTGSQGGRMTFYVDVLQ